MAVTSHTNRHDEHQQPDIPHQIQLYMYVILCILTPMLQCNNLKRQSKEGKERIRSHLSSGISSCTHPPPEKRSRTTVALWISTQGLLSINTTRLKGFWLHCQCQNRHMFQLNSSIYMIYITTAKFNYIYLTHNVIISLTCTCKQENIS